MEAAMGRLILVGEAPGGKGAKKAPALDPSGKSGRTLARMMDLEPEEYKRRTVRFNLFQAPDEGRLWNLDRARAAARVFNANQVRDDDRVILLGARVAQAFGVVEQPLLRWIEAEKPWSGERWWVARVPHPSGRNRVLNDNVMRARMTQFLCEAVELTSG